MSNTLCGLQVPDYDASMSAQRRPPDVDDEFLTVAEIASILKLNQQTVRNWIDQGSLPALRVGRRVRVLRRDLDQLIAQRRGGVTHARAHRARRARRYAGVARRPTVLGRRVIVCACA